jgi:hypothetical protein
VTSRDAALQIASKHLRQHGRHAQIGAVLDWDEITWRKPAPYTVRPIPLAECWICYVRPDAVRLASSEIVAVSRETGDVLYASSASDEG